MGKAIDGKSNLHQVGTIPLGSYFNIIWNNTLYTGEGNAVRCYNIGPGVNLSAISYKSFDGQIFYQEPVTGMNISGGKLYVTTDSTVNVAGLDDALHPANLGSITKDASRAGFRDVRVVGKYAYVGGTPKLSVFDISDPANPKFSKDLSEPGSHGLGIWRLEQEGNYLYGGYGNENLFSIWDISSAGNPVVCYQQNCGDLFRSAGTGI